MSISKCIFQKTIPENNFEMLTRLTLKEITFNLFTLKFPKLVSLNLENCHRTNYFPQLINLKLLNNDDLNSILQCYFPNLNSARILLPSEVVSGERITMTKLLSNWSANDSANVLREKAAAILKAFVDSESDSSIKRDHDTWLDVAQKLAQGMSPGEIVTRDELTLDASFLKYIAPGGTVPDELQTEKYKLHHLVMNGISYDLEEISCILRLIRVLHKLYALEIRAADRIHADMKVEEYLDEPSLLKQSCFYRLKTVKMISFQGSGAELRFVKLVLENFPSLKRMCIKDKIKFN